MNLEIAELPVEVLADFELGEGEGEGQRNHRVECPGWILRKRAGPEARSGRNSLDAQRSR
jgi:hypothetical protein